MGIEIGVIVGAISTGLALGTTGATATVVTAITLGALQAGLSYTISALTAPSPPKPPSVGIDNLRNIQRDPQAPGRVYYGHGFGSGYLAFAEVTDYKGRTLENAIYLHSCLIVAVGPIAGIRKIHLNDEKDLSTFGDLVAFVPFAGAWDQQMFKGPVGIKRKQVELPESWLRENRPLSGIAYVWATMAAHPTVFSGGPPSIRMEVDGAIIYDRRSPVQSPDDPYTWEFSNNWAVCVYDYLTNKEYGRGARHDQMCEDCFLESARISDEWTNAPSAKEKDDSPMPQIRRYAVDGTFETNEQPVDIMTTLAATAAGTITFYDGQWHIRAGAPRATLLESVPDEHGVYQPVVLTPDNLREDEPLLINVRPGRKEASNIVRGSFVNPKDEFTVQDFPEQTHPDFVKEDGGIELATQLDFPYVQDVDRAQRLARISLYMGRLGMRVTFPGGPELLQIPPWEVIELAFPEYGWGKINEATGEVEPNIVDPTTISPTNPTGTKTFKQFYVVDRHFNEDAGINLILAEYSNAMYSDTINPALLPERSGLPDPFAVFPPQDVTVDEVIRKLPDGTRVSVLVVQWKPPEDGYSDFYIVTWHKEGSLDPYMSRTVPGDMLMTEITGLGLGRYEIQIQTRVLNKLSAPVIVYGTVTYDAGPPPNPVNFQVSLQITGTRRFSWDIAGGVEPPDLRGYEIRFVRGTTVVPEWDEARIFQKGIIHTRMFETRQPVKEGDYVFLLKSLDLTGTYSEKFAVARVFISPRESTDLANREYSEEEWPGELANCRVGSRNQLEAFGTSTWDTAPTWAAMDTWVRGVARLTYAPPAIYLTAPDFATFEFKVEGQGIAGYYVQARVLSVTGNEFTPYKFLNGASGKGFQFRLIAWNDNDGPLVVDKFYVTLRAKDETDQLQSLVVPNHDPIIRVEGTAALQSTGQVTHINATPAGITLDESTWMHVAGSAYVTLPTLAQPVLFGDGTVEITVHIFNVTQAGRIIGRGTDWSVDYTYETVGAFQQGTFRFNASGYDVGYPPMIARIGRNSLGIHEIALVMKNNDISFYVDQRLIGTWEDVAFIPSSDPVVIAAKSTSAIVGNYSQIDAKECRIWKVALTPDQMRAASGISVDQTAPDLLGYWKLDDDFVATTVVRDRASGAHHGTAVGAVSPVRVGSRLSPVIDLAIIPKWGLLRGSWKGSRPAGTGLTVYMGIGQGDNPPAQYQPIVDPNSEVTINTEDVLPAGTVNPVGYKLWCLQTLFSANVTTTPTLTEVMTSIYYVEVSATDVVVPPPHPFSVIRQVSLSVRSTATVPIGWNLLAVDPVAARFNIYNSTTGAAVATTVDVLFQGSRIWT